MEGDIGILHRGGTRAALETLGSILPLILFLAPMTAIQNVVKTKSVGVLPSLPFTSMFLNCLLWSLFGVKLMEKAMIIPNAFGLLVSCYYIKTYNTYATESMAVAYMVTATISCIGFLAFWIGDATHIGNMASLASISMLAAPLAQTREVIATGNTAILGTVPMSLVGFCTALTWTVIGFFYLNNAQVYVANFLGFVASSITLLLFAFFSVKADVAYKPIMKEEPTQIGRSKRKQSPPPEGKSPK